MRFGNIHITQNQVRGGHVNTRNNVIIQQNNVYLENDAPKPPKVNFFQGLLAGLTGGGIFGGMGGLFGGGCNMPIMPGMYGMGGSIFGNMGMRTMMPFGMGTPMYIPQGTTSTFTHQDSGEVTLEQATQQLKTSFGSRYNINYIDNKINITDKNGNDIYNGTSLDDAQKALEGRNGKLDQQVAEATKKKEAMEKADLVEVDGKYYKKDDTERKTEYLYNDKTGTFTAKEAPAAAKAEEQE